METNTMNILLYLFVYTKSAPMCLKMLRIRNIFDTLPLFVYKKGYFSPLYKKCSYIKKVAGMCETVIRLIENKCTKYPSIAKVNFYISNRLLITKKKQNYYYRNQRCCYFYLVMWYFKIRQTWITQMKVNNIKGKI